MKTRKILIPAHEKELSDKSFSYETYIIMSLNAKVDLRKDSKNRYFPKRRFIGKEIAPKAGLSYPTFAKNLGYLLENKYILEDENRFIIKNKLKSDYVLIEVDTINKLLKEKMKNLIKVYVVYYRLFSMNSNCYMNQREILKSIGLKHNDNNLSRLRAINDKLVELDLIRIDKINTCIGKKNIYLNNISN